LRERTYLDVLRRLKTWTNPTLKKLCVCVCVRILGYRLTNKWHFWRLTDLLSATCWHLDTQSCDLGGTQGSGGSRTD